MVNFDFYTAIYRYSWPNTYTAKYDGGEQQFI